ncbi:MAG: pilin [Parcubacteria group bacterium]
MVKKQLLTLGFLGAVFVFLFSVNFALAQTCSDPDTPGGETGQCRSSCNSATEHQITGTCMGQVCCAANLSTGFPTDTAKTTTVSAFDKCIADGGDYDDCKTYPGAPASSSSSNCQGQGNLCGGSNGECCSPFACYQESQTTTGISSSTCQLSGYSGSSSTSGSSSSSSAGAAASGGWSLGNISGFGLPSGSIWRIVTNILVWMLGLFGIIGILGFLISGIIYLTAAGDEDRMGYAKRAMQYSIIGVIVGLVGFVIIQAIDYALNTYSSF